MDANVPKPDPNVTTRVRFEQHRAKPECAGCHALMDPLGLPFEIYDGIGRFRTMDGRRAGRRHQRAAAAPTSDGPVKDAIELMGRLAGASQVRACLAQPVVPLRASGASTPTATSRPSTAALEAFGRAGHRLPDLMVALTTTNAFRFRRPVDLP